MLFTSIAVLAIRAVPAMAIVALGVLEFGLDLAVGDNTSAAADLLCLFPMGKGIKYVTEIGGDAVKGGSKVKNLYKLASKGTGKGVEQVLDSVKTYEQARNKALNIIGDLGPKSKPYVCRLEASSAKGKIVGRISANRKVRWRLDYDPNKGIHINIEDFRNGKGADAIKIAIPFEGDEKLFDSLLKHLNK